MYQGLGWQSEHNNLLTKQLISAVINADTVTSVSNEGIRTGNKLDILETQEEEIFIH